MARNYLIQYHAPGIVANQLGRSFNISAEKIVALALLAGYDFAAAPFSNTLTRILHEPSTLTELIDLIEDLSKLVLWFEDDAFDPASLAFIQANSGDASAIFQITGADYRDPQLVNLQQTIRFRDLLRAANGTPEDLFTVLRSLAFDGSSDESSPKVCGDGG